MTIGGTSITGTRDYVYSNQPTTDANGNTFMSTVKEFENHADVGDGMTMMDGTAGAIDDKAEPFGDKSNPFEQFSNSFGNQFKGIKKR